MTRTVSATRENTRRNTNTAAFCGTGPAGSRRGPPGTRRPPRVLGPGGHRHWHGTAAVTGVYPMIGGPSRTYPGGSRWE
eukprot:747116-Hanusia_phi.AAC.5